MESKEKYCFDCNGRGGRWDDESIDQWYPCEKCQSDDTEQQVINDILARQQTGIQKYGTTLANNPLPLREWLNHAYLECLDQALYLKRAMMEMDK